VTDIGRWLEDQGLGKYAETFAENDIGLDILPDLDREDLKDLGVSLGDSKRLLKLVRALAEQPDPSVVESRSAPHVPLVVPARTDAERRQLTVMFCDLVGSVQLAEKMDVEDYRTLLSAFRQVVVDAIHALEGFVARHQGDGVLAYFGYPQARENDAERAVRAGRRIVSALSQSDNARVAALEVRIGIATGPAVVGDVLSTGSSDRSELAALGQTPNLAARLQATAGANGIVISTTTARLAGQYFQLRAREDAPLKGMGRPVASFDVVGERSSSSGSELLAETPRLPSMVGRQGEIALSLQRWEQASAGSGQTVLVSAEPGVGKTRLVREIRDRIKSGEGQRTTITLFCSPLYSGSALHPVAETLKRALHAGRDEGSLSQLEKLDSYLTELGIDDSAAVPLLASVLSLPLSAPYEIPKASPALLRRLTLETLADLVERSTNEGPVVLIAEDVHWADPTTLDFLNLVIERSRSWKLLVLLTFRPEFDPPWRDRAHVTSLTLNHLTTDESAALARSIVSDSELSDELLSRVVERADGVPLFIEELAQTVSESRPDGEASIPETLSDTLTARLDRLGDAKRIAQLASVIGRVFSFELVHELSGESEAAVTKALEALEVSGLITQGRSAIEPIFEFKHALVQEAAYAGMLRDTRRQLHRRLAETLERTQPGLADGQPEVLARHYSAADLSEAALVHWRLAGERAGRQSAHLEAVSHFTSALRTLAGLPNTSEYRRAELEVQMLFAAEQQMVIGQTADEVEAAYVRAETLAEEFEPGASWPVQFGMWRLRISRGELQASMPYRDALTRLADNADDPLMSAGARLAVGVSAFYAGKPREAARALAPTDAASTVEEMDTLTLRTGMPVGLSSPMYFHLARWFLGWDDEAREAMAELEAFARRLGRPYELGMMLAFVAAFGAMRREPGLAQRAAAECARISSEHHFPVWLWISRAVSGWAEAMQGDSRAGVLTLENALSDIPRVRGGLVMPFISCLLAESFVHVGERERAREAIDEARARASQNGEDWWKAEIVRQSGLIYAAHDDSQNLALEEFDRAMSIAHSQGSPVLELRAALSAAHLLVEMGRTAEAASVLTSVQPRLLAEASFPERLEADALLADLSGDRPKE
jgi:class 3 adenylate cyclase